MWLGDVPSPAPCAVLGPLPSTVCRAGCWSSGRPWGQWGLYPTKPWWLQLCGVPDAPGLVLGVCTGAGCPVGQVPCP